MLTLDPRTKLALALMYAIVVVVSNQLTWLLAELSIVVCIVLLAKQGYAYLRWLLLIASTLIFWLALAWWTLDMQVALIVGLRLMVLMTTFFTFFRTTAPEDIGNALVQMGMPYMFAFVLSTSLQFVPVMGSKAHHVIDAQRSRGIPLEPGFAALRHYPALLAPLLVQAFQLADELAEAMEARGFSRAGRTFAQTYRLRMYDWAVLIGAGSVVVVVLIVRFMNPV